MELFSYTHYATFVKLQYYQITKAVLLYYLLLYVKQNLFFYLNGLIVL